MDFNFSEEQLLLRESVRKYVRDRIRTGAICAVSEVPDFQPEIWRGLADELGILGAAISEEKGGFGGGAVEQMIIMEEFGRGLVRQPYTETIVTGGEILARCGGNAADQLLEAVIAGRSIVAYAWAEPGLNIDLRRVTTEAVRRSDGWHLSGHKSVVVAAPWASHLIVLTRVAGEDALALFLVDRSLPGIRCDDFILLDGRWAADVTFDAVALPDEARLTSSDAHPLALEIADRAIAASCAEAVGLMSQLLDDTMDYIKHRRQFGTPLSTFQVLRHRVADMFIQLEMATSSAYLATLSLGETGERRGFAVASAKVVVDEAARFVGQNAIQLHGGMGMTDELAIGHYVKRLMTIGMDFGSPDLHIARFAKIA